MKYKASKLVNGITVSTCSIASVESVSIGIWVDIGARYENKNINGISHFLEHMLFKGTKSKSSKQIAEQIENLGGYMNAYTTNETTAYYVKTLKEHTNESFSILADMLLNPVFSDIEKEKQVVLQEINQVYDSPPDIIFDYFQDNCFSDQKLGMSILGTAEVVLSLSKDTLHSYLRNYFANDKIVISAAGACDHEQIVELVERVFTKFIPKSDVKLTPEPAIYTPKTFTENRNEIEQSHLVIGFAGATRDSEDFYTLSAFSSIFGGGMSSILFQKIREELGLAYAVYSFLSSFKDTGVFGIYAGTSHDCYDKVIDTALNEIEKFQVTDIELLRAKNQMKSSFLMSNESTFAIAERMAYQLMTFGHLRESNDILKIIDNISADDINLICSKIKNSAMAKTIITK